MEIHPSQGASEEYSNCVCKTIDALLPMYQGGTADTPDHLPGTHPDTSKTEETLRILIDVMLPSRMSEGTVNRDELGVFLMRRLGHAWRNLRPEIERAIPYRWMGAAAVKEGPPEVDDAATEAVRVTHAFIARLPDIRQYVIDDIQAAYNGDPAALSYAEVQLAYPGLLAIVSHRIAHELYALKVPILPRIMSEWTHAQTGVDIHPGADIGRGLFIDHATGVVIGETAHIGDQVKIYQGVTLGAKSFPLDKHGNPIKHVQRHPTVEDHVIIYANSTILGNITLGTHSVIGGNVFLMEDVPPHSMVTAKHAELKIRKGS